VVYDLPLTDLVAYKKETVFRYFIFYF
jgi:hypothetical protein